MGPGPCPHHGALDTLTTGRSRLSSFCASVRSAFDKPWTVREYARTGTRRTRSRATRGGECLAPTSCATSPSDSSSFTGSTESGSRDSGKVSHPWEHENTQNSAQPPVSPSPIQPGKQDYDSIDESLHLVPPPTSCSGVQAGVFPPGSPAQANATMCRGQLSAQTRFLRLTRHSAYRPERAGTLCFRQFGPGHTPYRAWVRPHRYRANPR